MSVDSSRFLFEIAELVKSLAVEPLLLNFYLSFAAPFSPADQRLKGLGGEMLTEPTSAFGNVLVVLFLA